MGIFSYAYKTYFSKTTKNKSIYTSKWSIAYNLTTSIFKLMVGFLFTSIFFVTGGSYSLALAFIRIVYLKGVKKDLEEERKYFMLMTIALYLTFILYFFYTTNFYTTPNLYNYRKIIGIGVAIFGVTDFVIALIGIRKSRKQEDLLLKGVKMVCLTSALTSLSLTLSAFLTLIPQASNEAVTSITAIGSTIIGLINIYLTTRMFKIFILDVLDEGFYLK